MLSAVSIPQYIYALLNTLKLTSSISLVGCAQIFIQFSSKIFYDGNNLLYRYETFSAVLKAYTGKSCFW